MLKYMDEQNEQVDGWKRNKLRKSGRSPEVLREEEMQTTLKVDMLTV